MPNLRNTHEAYVGILGALIADGYSTDCYPFSSSMLEGLLAFFNKQEKLKIKPAGVGRQSGHQIDMSVRTDEIMWLDEQEVDTCNDRYLVDYFTWAQGLQLALNRELFLGLAGYESHFARYAPGAFYKKHKDAFKGQRNRLVSTVLYLNPSWQPADGGELVLFKASENTLDSGTDILATIQPLFGRMVIFLSEEFPHEVLPSHKLRISLTGWYHCKKIV